MIDKEGYVNVPVQNFFLNFHLNFPLKKNPTMDNILLAFQIMNIF